MDVKFPTWQLPYLDAVSGIPAGNLHDKVEVAERAILVRLQVLSKTAGRAVEKIAIKEALDALHALKKDRLDFPNWGGSSVKSTGA